MASIGLKINDGSSTGINSGVADVLAKAMFGDPESMAKIALTKAQIATQAAEAQRYGTASALDIQQAKTQENQRALLDAEAAAKKAETVKTGVETQRQVAAQNARGDWASPLADELAGAVNKPTPVEKDRPLPDFQGPMPMVVKPEDAAKYATDVAAARARAKAIALGTTGNDPTQLTSAEREGIGISRYANPDPNTIRTDYTMLTGKAPTTTDVLMKGDDTGVMAKAAADIATANATPNTDIKTVEVGGILYDLHKDPATGKITAIKTQGVDAPKPTGPYSGTGTEQQDDNIMLLALDKRRRGEALTPPELDSYNESYSRQYVPKTVMRLNAAGQMEQSTVANPVPAGRPAPDEIANWKPGDAIKTPSWLTPGGGAQAQTPQAQTPVVQPQVQPQVQPPGGSQSVMLQNQGVPTVENPQVPTFGPKIALQPGVTGTPGAGGAFGINGPQPQPQPQAPVVQPQVQPVVQAPQAQATPANQPPKFTAAWATPPDIGPHTEQVATPGGGMTTMTVSGAKKDPIPTAEASKNYTQLLQSTDALRLLDSFHPGQIPGNLRLLLAGLGHTGINDSVIQSFSDPVARSYVRALQTVINGPERGESGAAIQPKEAQDYINRYIMPPNGTERDYIETKTMRMRSALAVRKGLDGLIPQAQLDYLDAQLVANHLDLLYGPNPHRMATPEEVQQAVRIAGSIPPGMKIEDLPKGPGTPAEPQLPTQAASAPGAPATVTALPASPAAASAPQPGPLPVTATPAAPAAAAPAAGGKKGWKIDANGKVVPK